MVTNLFITNICAYQARQYYVVSGSLLTSISQVCMVFTCTSSQTPGQFATWNASVIHPAIQALLDHWLTKDIIFAARRVLLVEPHPSPLSPDIFNAL